MDDMDMVEGLARLSGEEMAERVARATPVAGAAFAVFTVVATMKRKGVLRGGIDTALNVLPVVGLIKNVAEAIYGSDFISDRPAPKTAPSSQ